MRALLGHTCRAFLTVENYLAAATAATPTGELPTPEDYFRATRARLADPTAVMLRGRDAGQALGQHPQQTAAEIADRVTRLVTVTPADAPVSTPVGRMRLRAYLPTRAFELTVHGLVRALGLPDDPAGDSAGAAFVDCLGPAVDLCTRIAAPADRFAGLRALIGRGQLPPGFSVL
ncbi:mycothiol maleylpyruvate isomerase [Corynebacterium variabile]|uniref:mycothiol maleylpyruvate isomerase n=1 Tax=Corynebacterium variabile TaxID=1727 RepID=UPI003FD282C0